MARRQGRSCGFEGPHGEVRPLSGRGPELVAGWCPGSGQGVSGIAAVPPLL